MLDLKKLLNHQGTKLKIPKKCLFQKLSLTNKMVQNLQKLNTRNKKWSTIRSKTKSNCIGKLLNQRRILSKVTKKKNHPSESNQAHWSFPNLQLKSMIRTLKKKILSKKLKLKKNQKLARNESMIKLKILLKKLKRNKKM